MLLTDDIQEAVEEGLIVSEVKDGILFINGWAVGEIMKDGIYDQRLMMDGEPDE